MELMLEIAGWCGGAMVGLAFALVSTGRIQAQTRIFQLLNVAGGVLLTGTALQHGAVSNAVIDLVWVIFGVYALVVARARRRQRGHARSESLPADQPGRSTTAAASPTGEMTAV